MTFRELRAFLDTTAAEARSPNVCVRLLSDCLGDIERIWAYSPAPPRSDTIPLPGDRWRDAAAALQATREADLENLAAIRAASPDLWPALMIIARECVRLATAAGTDPDKWLTTLRAAGNILDLSTGGTDQPE